MKRKILLTLGISLLLIIGIITGGSFFMLDYSLKTDVLRDEKILWRDLFKSYPLTEQWVDSLRNESALRDTFITNKEGKRLHAYYVRATRQTPKTAVIVHGYTDNAINMMMIGYMFNKEFNYNILLPDLQYHGKSEGDAIQMGWKDRLDVMEWMNVANETFGEGENTEMVLHGISMGAASIMMISGEDQPDYVTCFIDDCGYTSAWDEFSGELEMRFGLPQFPMLYAASWLCKLKYGWSFKEASALKQVEKCELPMLFIHGDADTYVPTWMVHSLYDAKPGSKELWIVPGAKHAVSYKEHTEEYTERVKNFLDKYNL